MDPYKKSPRVVILGAGCTGLGAAYRLHELGHANFLVLERDSHPGGLAASFVDDRGFTWDLGGHVLFSHYNYFDRLMELALGRAWIDHVRQCSIWVRGRFVPYPLQNNLRHLPSEELARCLQGLVRAGKQAPEHAANFRDWITQSFGDGIADLFLLPYNFKVWAHPLDRMSCGWVGERVAPVDLDRVIENIRLARDDSSWGPNQKFRFPAFGGTGAIWTALARLVPSRHFIYNVNACRIDRVRRIVKSEDGREYPYDHLISTIPLDALSEMIGDSGLTAPSRRLKYATTHVVGIGLAGQPAGQLGSRNWMYFPEGDCPFYRVTVFSSYSPANVPNPFRFWSLMAEVSESPDKPVDRSSLNCQVIKGALATGLIRSEAEIISVWQKRLPHGYPIPTLDRDEQLDVLLPALEKDGIYSRGRFGAWRYEVANQDHSCMQGVEAVDRLLLGKAETTFCGQVTERR